MKILVYGAGAVGLGITSCLKKSGADVDVIAREDTVSAISEGGLIRDGIFGEYRASPGEIKSFSSLENLPAVVYDYILVCTKSFDTETAAKDLSGYPQLLNENTKIVLCQNGWGNAEIFTSFFREEQVYNARVITGFIRSEKNHVTITVHADAVRIGSLFGKDLSVMEPLARLIDEGGIPCAVTDSVEKDLWAKIFYNCALNSLGAIFEVKYGTLGEWEHTREIMRGIVEEAFRVMKAAGHETHWDSAEKYLETFYEKFLPSTYEHESSTLQDIRAGKKTEIDALNGAVIRLGEKLNIPVAYNFVVYNMVKFKEASKLYSGQNPGT